MAQNRRPNTSEVEKLAARVARLGLPRLQARLELAKRIKDFVSSSGKAPDRRAAVPSRARPVAAAAAAARAKQDEPRSHTRGGLRSLHRALGCSEPPGGADDADLLRSPAYNIRYALGDQEGMPVPLPQTDASHDPEPFQPATGVVQATLTIPAPAAGSPYASAVCLITICPYSQYPVAYCVMRDDSTILKEISMEDQVSNALDQTLEGGGVTLLTSVTDIPWFGDQDPRTLVCNALGPNFSDFDPEDTSPDAINPLQQQFMGGRFEITAAASYNAVGGVSVIDAKSMPTYWGSKLRPSDMADDAPTFTNTYDRDRYLKLYTSKALRANTAPLPVGDIARNVYDAGAQSVMVGGGDAARVHVHGLLPPDGQKWANWSGCFAAAGGGVAPAMGSGYAGGAAANNWYSRLVQGYPLIMVKVATGSGSVVLNLKAFFSYNCTIATDGTQGQALLAQSAPTTTPHSTPVAKLHAVIEPHNDLRAGHNANMQQTILRSREAGLKKLGEDHVVGVQPIRPSFARKALSVAGDIFHGFLEGVKAVAHVAIKTGTDILKAKATQAVTSRLEAAL